MGFALIRAGCLSPGFKNLYYLALMKGALKQTQSIYYQILIISLKLKINIIKTKIAGQNKLPGYFLILLFFN
ncbi:hypothetical protein MgSA37_01896 [Mucilaginibacter gotjawali]|uniref:Uncharacterized protein n=2 Tax=Mucilaginibacter gotjawali TaxID=1550579 RepID=A0A120MXS1_9SPHI|nr:hypothetical protein [Mucilaginibacter gotjawali]BAU53726.1 hypothetical protein MgSA37_01896 [Mucilaginibacter gotjawali]